MSGDGANFSRQHVWAPGETVVGNPTLNAEFDNILNNFTTEGLDDYSLNVTQMKIQTSPGGVGTESLATSAAGELERLRYVLARLVGGTNGLWYDTPALTLSQINTLLGTVGNIPANRIVSGRTRAAGDPFPIFLQADGAAATIRLKAATTSFSAYIKGVNYIANTDVALTGLSLAPSTNNTATVNDTLLSAQTDSLYAGEADSSFPTLTISGAGSNITALVGQFAAFKVGTEYFLAYVASSTQLIKAFRGHFFDNTDTPVIRTTITNGATVTLCKLAWVFFRTDGTLAVTYNTPTISTVQPSSPSPGDYWFDLTNLFWKTYNGSAFVDATAILVGVAVLDTAACKVSRSFNFYASYSNVNTVAPVLVDTSDVGFQDSGSQVSVNGGLISFGTSSPVWNKIANVDSGVTVGNSSTYYLYVNQVGGLVISNERPYYRADMLGRYHPYRQWRSVGAVTTDGSANFQSIVIPTSSAVDVGGLASISLATQVIVPNNNNNLADVSGSTITVTTRGWPVLLLVVPGPPNLTVNTVVGANWGTATGTTMHLAIVRDSSTYVGVWDGASCTAASPNSFPVCFCVVDTPPAGKHTYKLQYGSGNGGGGTHVINRAAIQALEIVGSKLLSSQ